MARFDFSDDEWSIIQPLLPKVGRDPGRVDDRKVLVQLNPHPKLLSAPASRFIDRLLN